VLELIAHELRHEQLEVAPVSQDAERHDPALSVTPLGQVEPCGDVDEEMEHGVRLTGRTLAPRSLIEHLTVFWGASLWAE
jgi:hypothetical protein